MIMYPRVYTDIGAAQRDARELQDGELDGWTYRVQCAGLGEFDGTAGLWVIAVSDATGEFVGYWGEPR